MTRTFALACSTLTAVTLLVLSWDKPGYAQEIITRDGKQYVVPKWDALKPQQATLPEKFADAKFKTVDLSRYDMPGTIDILESMEIVRDGPFNGGVAIKYIGNRTPLANIGLGGTDFPTYLGSVHNLFKYELNRVRDVFDATVDYMNSQFIRYENPQALFVEMTINGPLRYKGCIAVSAGDYDYWVRFDQYNQINLSRSEALLMLHIASTIRRSPEPQQTTMEYLKTLSAEYRHAETPKDIRLLDAQMMQKIPPRRYNIFAELTNLESVYASRSQLVDDRLLVALKDKTALKQLHLDGCAITNEGMKNLSALEHLWWLRLTETPISDEGLKPIARLRSITNLDLDRTQITDQGLAYLPVPSALIHLNLNGTNITDAGLVHLRRLPQLKSLSLRKTHIRGEGLNDLRTHRELEGLHLDEIKELRPHFLESLSTLTSLKSLSLAKTSATPRFLQHVANESLAHLHLEGTPTSDDDLKYLVRFPNLKELDLTGCNQLTGETIPELANLGQLESLKLPATVKPENWLKLAEMKQLTYLKLGSPLQDLDPFCVSKDPDLNAELARQKELLNQLRESLPNCQVDLYLR